MLRKANKHRIKIIVEVSDLSSESSAIGAARDDARPVWKTRLRKTRDALAARQRYGCIRPSTTLRKSASSSSMRSIFSTECITVEWCLSLKSRPISG